MGCRVGITTNPEDRKQDWERKYPNLKGWEILASYSYRPLAEAREEDEAGRRGCDTHQGGREPDREGAQWFVYHFEF